MTVRHTSNNERVFVERREHRERGACAALCSVRSTLYAPYAP